MIHQFSRKRTALKLGDIVSDIDFSDSEKARIAESFKNRNGNPYRVLHEYYSEVRAMDFWSNAHKLLAINGYRPGKAKDTVLRRCLDAVDDSASKANLVLWRLYRRCVHQHMTTESLRLNTLLAKENAPENFEPSTEGIFREIIRLAPLYEVTHDQIREFYDIWAFARFEGFDGLFQNSGSDLEILKRLLTQENQQSQAKIQKILDESTIESRKEINSLKTEVQNLSSEIGRLDSKIVASVAVVRSEMQNLAATTVNQKISEVSASLKKSIAETARSGSSDPGLADEVLKLGEQVSRLSKKVATFSSQNTIPNQRLMATVSPVAESQNLAAGVNNWIRLLESFGLKNPNLFALVSAALVRSNSILILDHLDLLKPLLTALYGSNHLRIRAANPTWTSPESWSADLDWMTGDAATPKAMVLCDFDVPLQECYLVPALVEWRAKLNSSKSKIFLVRSSAANQVFPRLFELGLELPSLDEFEISDVVSTPVSTDLLHSLLSSGFSHIEPTQEAKAHEEHLRILGRNNGFRLTPDLTSGFSRLLTLLGPAVGQETAFQIALDMTVLNWVENVAGKARKQVFEERLNSILSVSNANG